VDPTESCKNKSSAYFGDFSGSANRGDTIIVLFNDGEYTSGWRNVYFITPWPPLPSPPQPPPSPPPAVAGICCIRAARARVELYRLFRVVYFKTIRL